MEIGEAARARETEMWDRLTLLLVARPLEGWEPEFEEISRREIERLKPLHVSEAGNE